MNKLLTTISLLVSLLIASGCHKTQVMPAAFTGSALLHQVDNDSSLILFNAALKRCNLDSAFASGGPFTIFAPVDSAFLNAGLTLEKINAFDPDSLRDIIGYHILYGRVSTTDLLGFLRQQFTSLDPYQEPFIIKNFYGVFINGIKVVQGDIELPDGVLHKISRVAFPPSGDLYQTIFQQPNLKIFQAMLQINSVYVYYSQGLSFQSLLEGPSANLTLLIPSDSAFIEYGITPYYLDTANPGAVLQMIQPPMSAAIVGGEFFTADFLAGFVVNGPSAPFYLDFPASGYEPVSFELAIAPSSLNLSVGYQNGYDPQTLYQYPTREGNIVQPDIVATNGTIQIIDSVLHAP